MSADATNLSRDHVAHAALSRQRLNPLQSALRPGQVLGFFRWRDAGINVCFWHLADMQLAPMNVCFRE